MTESLYSAPIQLYVGLQLRKKDDAAPPDTWFEQSMFSDNWKRLAIGTIFVIERIEERMPWYGDNPVRLAPIGHNHLVLLIPKNWLSSHHFEVVSSQA